jgi:hypothetical protein
LHICPFLPDSVLPDSVIPRLQAIKKQFNLNEKRDFTTLQALHEVQASIKLGEKSPWYYHWVNLAINSAKRHVTNTEDIINAAARGHAHIALLDNRNLTAVWNNMTSYAAIMGLTPMTDTLHQPTKLRHQLHQEEGGHRKHRYCCICISAPYGTRCCYAGVYVCRHAISGRAWLFLLILSQSISR